MIGQVIDHFKIIAQLGEDDRNDVWDAEDTRIGRRVAIKFLHKELSRNKIAIERFRREAQLASQLSHPNLCTILDIGNHDDAGMVFETVIFPEHVELQRTETFGKGEQPVRRDRLVPEKDHTMRVESFLDRTEQIVAERV